MPIRTCFSLAVVLAAIIAYGAEPAPKGTLKKPALDVGKGRVEASTKNLVKRSASARKAAIKNGANPAQAPVEVQAESPPLAKKPPLKAPFPVSKMVIESATKSIVKSSAPALKKSKTSPATPDGAVDRPKRAVEAPTKRVVRAAGPGSAKPQAAKSGNPRVSPGKVRWAGNYTKALAAAKKSGKPVLLFQLLGELDRRFT